MAIKNDYMALMINKPDFTQEDLFVNDITKNNTQLLDREYYKNIDKVKNKFTDSNGVFNDTAYNQFYDSTLRAYSSWQQDEYSKDFLDMLPTQKDDIFHGTSNVIIPSVRIDYKSDPWRSSHGLGVVVANGTPSFDIREVAQANYVRDENGNKLDWTANDKGGFFKGLFRPNLALAQYDSDGYHIENGVEVYHRKGDYKLDENGDPYTEVITDKEKYGRDLVSYFDTITRDDSAWNKIDPFDGDSLNESISKTIYKTTVRLAPYLIPGVREVFGALGAAQGLGKALPTLTKSILDIAGLDDTSLYNSLTNIENAASRFDFSKTRYSQSNSWSLENIGDIISSSAAQLYQQSLLWKIPGVMTWAKSAGTASEIEKRINLISRAGTSYMALTSAVENYGQFKEAGANNKTAAIGYLATLGGYFGLMQTDYFRKWLIKDGGWENLGDLYRVVETDAKNQIDKIAQREISEKIVSNVGKSTTTQELKGFKKLYNTITNSAKNYINNPNTKIGSVFAAGSTYVNRAFNEGVEETMEEVMQDIVKGGIDFAEELGINVRRNEVDNVDFNWSLQDIISRYSASFIGGAIGGAVFEGLNNFEHKGKPRLKDQSLDTQFVWYAVNQGKDVQRVLDDLHKKGKLGSTTLSAVGELVEDSDNPGTMVWKYGSVKSGELSQNDAIYNELTTRLAGIQSQLMSLGMFNGGETKSELIKSALTAIDEAAEKEGISSEEYKQKHFTNEFMQAAMNSEVGRYVIDDASDLRIRAIELTNQIRNKEDEIRNSLQDTEKSKADELIKNNEFLKQRRNELKEVKDAYNDLITGKNAYKYKEYGMFMAIPDLAGTYEINYDDISKTGLESYVRLRHNLDYLSETLSNTDKEILKKEYDSYMAARSAGDVLSRYRKAFELHTRLNEQYAPVINQQKEKYKGLKYDANATNAQFDSYLAAQTKQIQDRLNTIAETLPTLTDQEEINNLNREIKSLQESLQAVNYWMSSPEIMGTRANVIKEGGAQEELLIKGIYTKDYNINDQIKLIEDFYNRMKNDHLFYGWADEFYLRSMSMIFDRERINLLDRLDSARKIQKNYDIVARAIQLLNPNLEFMDYGEPIIDGTPEQLQEVITELNSIEDPRFDKIKNLLFDAINHQEDWTDEIRDGLIEEINNYESESGITNDDNYNNIVKLINNAFDDAKHAPERANEIFSNLYSDISHPNAKLFWDGKVNDLGKGKYEVEWAKKISEIGELAASNLESPVFDLLRNIAWNNGVENLPVLDQLEMEMKKLQSRKLTTEYILENPDLVKQLDIVKGLIPYLVGTVSSASSGYNMMANAFRKENSVSELATIDGTLSTIYSNELSYLLNRIDFFKSITELTNDAAIKENVNATLDKMPKFVNILISEPENEVSIANKLNKSLGIDFAGLWVKAGGEDIDLNTIADEARDDVDKAKKLIETITEFERLIYEQFNGVNQIPLNEKLNELIDIFDGCYYQKNSIINSNKDIQIENYDALMYLLMAASIDSDKTEKQLSSIYDEFPEQKKNIIPLYAQKIAIKLGYASIVNPSLFNAANDAVKAKVDSITNDDAVKEKTVVYNSIFINGGAGCGKSSVVSYIINELAKINFKDAGLETFVTAKVLDRMNAFKTDAMLMEANDTNGVVTETMIKTVLGKLGITGNDALNKLYENKELVNLSEDIKNRINNSTITYDELLNLFFPGGHAQGNNNAIIFVDESGLLSRPEIEFLGLLARKVSVDGKSLSFVFNGDTKQNQHKLSGSNKTDGWEDLYVTKCPTLAISLRAENKGKWDNYNALFTILDKVEKMLSDAFSYDLNEAKQKINSVLGGQTIDLIYKTNQNNTLCGDKILNPTDNFNSELEKLINGANDSKRVAIIVTDNDAKSKYSPYSETKHIAVLTQEEAQGNQYDYVAIDVDFGNNAYLAFRNLYTLTTRAKQGSIIKYSPIFDKKVRSISEDRAAAQYGLDKDERAKEAANNYKTWISEVYAKYKDGSQVTNNPTQPTPAPTPSPAPQNNPTPEPKSVPEPITPIGNGTEPAAEETSQSNGMDEFEKELNSEDSSIDSDEAKQWRNRQQTKQDYEDGRISQDLGFFWEDFYDELKSNKLDNIVKLIHKSSNIDDLRQFTKEFSKFIFDLYSKDGFNLNVIKDQISAFVRRYYYIIGLSDNIDASLKALDPKFGIFTDNETNKPHLYYIIGSTYIPIGIVPDSNLRSDMINVVFNADFPLRTDKGSYYIKTNGTAWMTVAELEEKSGLSVNRNIGIFAPRNEDQIYNDGAISYRNRNSGKSFVAISPVALEDNPWVVSDDEEEDKTWHTHMNDALFPGVQVKIDFNSYINYCKDLQLLTDAISGQLKGSKESPTAIISRMSNLFPIVNDTTAVEAIRQQIQKDASGKATDGWNQLYQLKNSLRILNTRNIINLFSIIYNKAYTDGNKSVIGAIWNNVLKYVTNSDLNNRSWSAPNENQKSNHINGFKVQIGKVQYFIGYDPKDANQKLIIEQVEKNSTDTSVKQIKTDVSFKEFVVKSSASGNVLAEFIHDVFENVDGVNIGEVLDIQTALENGDIAIVPAKRYVTNSGIINPVKYFDVYEDELFNMLIKPIMDSDINAATNLESALNNSNAFKHGIYGWVGKNTTGFTRNGPWGTIDVEDSSNGLTKDMLWVDISNCILPIYHIGFENIQLTNDYKHNSEFESNLKQSETKPTVDWSDGTSGKVSLDINFASNSELFNKSGISNVDPMIIHIIEFNPQTGEYSFTADNDSMVHTATSNAIIDYIKLNVVNPTQITGTQINENKDFAIVIHKGDVEFNTNGKRFYSSDIMSSWNKNGKQYFKAISGDIFEIDDVMLTTYPKLKSIVDTDAKNRKKYLIGDYVGFIDGVGYIFKHQPDNSIKVFESRRLSEATPLTGRILKYQSDGKPVFVIDLGIYGLSEISSSDLPVETINSIITSSDSLFLNKKNIVKLQGNEYICSRSVKIDKDFLFANVDSFQLTPGDVIIKSFNESSITIVDQSGNKQTLPFNPESARMAFNLLLSGSMIDNSNSWTIVNNSGDPNITNFVERQITNNASVDSINSALMDYALKNKSKLLEVTKDSFGNYNITEPTSLKAKLLNKAIELIDAGQNPKFDTDGEFVTVIANVNGKKTKLYLKNVNGEIELADSKLIEDSGSDDVNINTDSMVNDVMNSTLPNEIKALINDYIELRVSGNANDQVDKLISSIMDYFVSGNRNLILINNQYANISQMLDRNLINEDEYLDLIEKIESEFNNCD